MIPVHLQIPNHVCGKTAGATRAYKAAEKEKTALQTKLESLH